MPLAEALEQLDRIGVSETNEINFQRQLHGYPPVPGHVSRRGGRQGGVPAGLSAEEWASHLRQTADYKRFAREQGMTWV